MYSPSVCSCTFHNGARVTKERLPWLCRGYWWWTVALPWYGMVVWYTQRRGANSNTASIHERGFAEQWESTVWYGMVVPLRLRATVTLMPPQASTVTILLCLMTYHVCGKLDEIWTISLDAA